VRVEVLHVDDADEEAEQTQGDVRPATDR
jgi:hypothetical protein